MTQEKIDRIKEKAEQAALRREYIQSVTGSLRVQLDNTSVQEADGSIHALKPSNKPKLPRS